MDKVLEQFQFTRRFTLNNIQKLEEKHADVQPAGFNNTLRWNYAHILTAYEKFVFQLSGRRSKLALKFMELFSSGTRPSDWTVKAPSLEEIANELEIQREILTRTFSDSLDEMFVQPIEISGVKIETVRDALIFCIWHEGLHQGMIKAITRVVSNE